MVVEWIYNVLNSYLEKINLPNVALKDSNEIARDFLVIGMSDFYQAINHIHQFPYGRTSDRANYHLVLKEQRGTCSTKHALIAELARSLSIPLNLRLGLILLDEENTPKIAPILKKYQLTELPETHTYLVYQGSRLDITFPNGTNYQMNYPLLKEVFISPQETGDFKITWHEDAIREWLTSQTLNYDLAEIWKIRELCISVLHD